MIKKIYLAGPDVFLSNAIEIGQKKKDLCKKYGFEGRFPLDNEIDPCCSTPYETGLKISQINEELIRECNLVIANITPFRGPSADIGTIFEIGLAKGSGLQIFAYTNTKILFTERTVRFLGIKSNKDVTGLKDNNGMKIEQFGMTDNLMIDGGIVNNKGMIFSGDVPENEMYTSLVVFEECLKYLQYHLI
jgi:nucleoside 2-deoxyribosyltransferase